LRIKKEILEHEHKLSFKKDTEHEQRKFHHQEHFTAETLVGNGWIVVEPNKYPKPKRREERAIRLEKKMLSSEGALLESAA